MEQTKNSQFVNFCDTLLDQKSPVKAIPGPAGEDKQQTVGYRDLYTESKKCIASYAIMHVFKIFVLQKKTA